VVTGMEAGVRIVALPSEDEEFARRVRQAALRLNGAASDGDPFVSQLTRELSADYPELAIRQQGSLATLGNEPTTWYAYRDGNGRGA
jgi:hypothetical protein